ncbi:hypothetical protein [Streptomyces paromomycinus]|uniref:Sensor domain-containing protein n=1 Tax=Streptomyces paromomycinus TaxID=92743 RepID=A0A401VXN5_STREY|nr:hypothetical protein [Streptomyces paromomycinus]GCD41819.1 hypothetical protein GKJPGBOP_01476 [Streptomyces paromomycinus]
MRLRPTALFSLAAVSVLAMSSCSATASTAAADKAAASPARSTGDKPASPLSAGQLQERLLTAADLGRGYTVKPVREARHEKVTVVGCPALEKLGGEAAAGGVLDFPRRASVSFAYTGEADSEVSEDLYSDSAPKLSAASRRIFAAMASCPAYRVTIGSTPVEVATEKVPAPRLGEEHWSQTLTFTVSGRSSVVKQTAVRTGTVLVVVSGSPGLVDAHVHKAVSTARAAT